MKDICAQVVVKLMTMNGVGSQYTINNLLLSNERFFQCVGTSYYQSSAVYFSGVLTPKQCPIHLRQINCKHRIQFRVSPGTSNQDIPFNRAVCS